MGVSTSPIAATMIVVALKMELNPSWLVIPRKMVISLIKPLIPGRASDARELAKKNAKVIGRTFFTILKMLLHISM